MPVNQQTKHWCVTSAVLVTNPKPSTLQAAVKKITLLAKTDLLQQVKNVLEVLSS